MSDFRFQNLVIWQKAADLAVELDELSEILNEQKKYRFAEQLRAAGLSISNNIAEGSGSNTIPDFRKFLYIARKSAFECASMLMIFTRRNYIAESQSKKLLEDLEAASRMIVAFAKSLKD